MVGQVHARHWLGRLLWTTVVSLSHLQCLLLIAVPLACCSAECAKRDWSRHMRCCSVLKSSKCCESLS